jgi:spermine oxidase
MLTEAGVKNVTVLEANDRIGGRINSIPINGKWIEFGAQWIHGQGKNPLWKFVDDQKVISDHIFLFFLFAK